MSDLEEINKKKEVITQKLSERETNRLAEINQRDLDKEIAKAENEEIENFIKTLNQEKFKVEDEIRSVQELSDMPKITDILDSLTIRCQKLQKFVNDSRIFLPSYNLRKSQEIVSSLLAAVQQTQEALMPTKKFAFRRNKAGKPGKSQAMQSEVVDVNKNSQSILQECDFQNTCGQLLRKSEQQINNKDVVLHNLSDCKVVMEGSPSTIHMTSLTNCDILIGPVATSVFIEQCNDCNFVLACQQLRIHATKNCKFYIHVTSRAIIEDCNGLGFGPHNWTYPSMHDHYQIAGLNQSINHWNDVADFNWLSTEHASPNWFIIKEADRQKFWE